MPQKQTSRRELCPHPETAGSDLAGWELPGEPHGGPPFEREAAAVMATARQLEWGRRADAAWREARKARAEAWIRRAGWNAMAVRNGLGIFFCLGWFCFAGLTLMDSSIPEGVLRSQYRAVWGWLLLLLMLFPIVSAVGGWAAEWCGKGLQHGLRWIARRRHIDV